MAYPRIRVWGEEYLLNTHLQTKSFQPVRVPVVCPKSPADSAFCFLNENPGHTLWLCNPALRLSVTEESALPPKNPNRPSLFEGVFPIGVYGATADTLEAVKRLAFNTVVIGGEEDGLRKQVQLCHELSLKYIISVVPDPDRLVPLLARLQGFVRPKETAFYVNDEPGIRSFPISRAEDVQGLIKARFPGVATCMAIVRPQVCRTYLDAADFFFLDPYPVPFMPMTWLSDVMDRAAQDAGAGRLGAVVQAFGGKDTKDEGWPRLPTWREMDCLSFLSVVHGGRGIFFFTFRVMGSTSEGRRRLGRVVGRLNTVYPWLKRMNADLLIRVAMRSANRTDPQGRPAVHACLKRDGNSVLLIAVNTIATHVEADIVVPAWMALEERDFEEVFRGEKVRLIQGRIRVRFGPYESKAFKGTLGNSLNAAMNGGPPVLLSPQGKNAAIAVKNRFVR